ncbi:MAG: GNAT family N-acetyltransferase, partial [Rhodococcus sp.]|nr:GNAT family N-acetyltransferase [Rhodococcus sp. (in: high G+C Gram-positive bacteria)]
MIPRVVTYLPQHRPAVVELSERAWEPVFAQLRENVPSYVYNAFYPRGWWERQQHDIETLLDEEAEQTLVALIGDEVCGWVSVRLHKEDSMGEIYIL